MSYIARREFFRIAGIWRARANIACEQAPPTRQALSAPRRPQSSGRLQSPAKTNFRSSATVKGRPPCAAMMRRASFTVSTSREPRRKGPGRGGIRVRLVLFEDTDIAFMIRLEVRDRGFGHGQTDPASPIKCADSSALINPPPFAARSVRPRPSAFALRASADRPSSGLPAPGGATRFICPHPRAARNWSTALRICALDDSVRRTRFWRSRTRRP